MKIEEKIFDIADEWLINHMKSDENVPVIGANKRWVGTVNFMMKIDEFAYNYGPEEEDIFNYQTLEHLHPYLKDLDKELTQKPDVEKVIKDGLVGINKDNYKQFEVKFTDIVVSLENEFKEKYTAKVYTCFDDYYTDACGLIDVDFDYPLSKLEELNFISGGYRKPIIGLKKCGGPLENRAVLALMPLDYKPHEVKKAMREQHKKIKKLFDGFYADELKLKGE